MPIVPNWLAGIIEARDALSGVEKKTEVPPPSLSLRRTEGTDCAGRCDEKHKKTRRKASENHAKGSLTAVRIRPRESWVNPPTTGGGK